MGLMTSKPWGDVVAPIASRSSLVGHERYAQFNRVG